MDPRSRFRILLWQAPASVLVLASMAVIFSWHVPPYAAGMVDVGAATVTAHPPNPGAQARVTITFTITKTLEINDSITFEVSDTLGVPRTIDSNHVYISGIGTTDRTGPDSTGPPARVSAPSQSVVVLANRQEHRHRITLNIPDMSVGGNQGGLSAGEVTVIFRQDAGITNRTEGGKDEWFVYTTAEPDLAAIPPERVYEVPFTVHLSKNHVHRGEKIAVTGRGFEGGTTVTFWRDSDNDGQLDSDEAVLCSVTATSEAVGKCAFTVAVPPFQGGVGSASDVNYVNAVDGHGHSASVHVPLIHLEPFIDISPDMGGIGDPVHVHLADLDPGDRVSRIQLAGRWLCDDAYDGNYDGTPDLPCYRFMHEDRHHGHAGDAGTLNFTLFIPGRSLDGSTVSMGFQELQVFIASQDRDIHDKELDAILHITPGQIITPSTLVLPNQRISVSGSGFTRSPNRGGEGHAFIGPAPWNVAHNCPYDVKATAAIDPYWGRVTLGDVEIDWSRINNGKGIQVSSGGTWAALIDLPFDSTTAPGVREFKVTDCSGGVGAIDLTFPEREVALTPDEGRVGSEVVISGKNFPVFNYNGSVIKIAVMYETQGRERDKEIVVPDEVGNFVVTLNIPKDTGIPSNNTVRLEFMDDNEFLTSNTFIHRVLAGTVSFKPTSGSAGTIVTLTGQGFNRYTMVHMIGFGALDISTGASLFTNQAGGFEMTFMVPATHTGYHVVLVKVDETIARAPFRVTPHSPMPAPASAPLPPADALASLIAHNNNLMRVWQFDASRQKTAPDFGWFLYDTRQVFVSANDLESIKEGRFYWIKVREAQTAIMGGKERVLHSGWNPVTW